ncbi:MAG: hypothetical protein K8I30_12665 [Anaerolineae bacterium]|nr:hypothetical protein [Anaerolineae bacterium]
MIATSSTQIAANQALPMVCGDLHNHDNDDNHNLNPSFNFQLLTVFTHPFVLCILYFALCTLHSVCRSGRSLPRSRRATADSAAVLMPSAAPTAAILAMRWLSPCQPPHTVAQRGGSFAVVKFFAIGVQKNAPRRDVQLNAPSAPYP